jgi:hypothetical protein
MALKMRNAIITMALALFTITSVEAKKADFDKTMFDKSSDFMKGFETGILVRSKKGDPSKFGCTIVHKSESDYINKAISSAKQSMSAIKLMLPTLNKESVTEVIDLVIEGLVGVKLLTKAIDPRFG